MELDNKQKVALFFKLKEFERLTKWEDIRIGEAYHIPPLIYNKRMDFVVVDKTENTIRIRKIGDEYSQTMFKSDVTSNFIIKKWCCNET